MVVAILEQTSKRKKQPQEMCIDHQRKPNTVVSADNERFFTFINPYSI